MIPVTGKPLCIDSICSCVDADPRGLPPVLPLVSGTDVSTGETCRVPVDHRHVRIFQSPAGSGKIRAGDEKVGDITVRIYPLQEYFFTKIGSPDSGICSRPVTDRHGDEDQRDRTKPVPYIPSPKPVHAIAILPNHICSLLRRKLAIPDEYGITVQKPPWSK